MSCTLRELIIKREGRDDDDYISQERKKFNDIWRAFGVGQFKNELKVGKSNTYQFDEEDADFFKKLLDDYNGPLWRKYFRPEEVQIESVDIEDNEVNLFEELEYVIKGLTTYYNKIVKNVERQRVFREALYSHTHYRKLKFENSLLDMMNNLPELDEYAMIHSFSGNTIKEYEKWLEALEGGLRNIYVKGCDQWNNKKWNDEKQNDEEQNDAIEKRVMNGIIQEILSMDFE